MGQPTSPDRWHYGLMVFETDKMEKAMAQSFNSFGFMVFETDRMKEAVTGAFSNSEMAEAYGGFIAASMKGYAIMDTGATTSMSGINLLLHCQETLQRQVGEDVVLVDPEATTRSNTPMGPATNLSAVLAYHTDAVLRHINIASVSLQFQQSLQRYLVWTGWTLLVPV